MSSSLVPPHMVAGDVWRSAIVNAILDAIGGGAHQFTKQTATYTAQLSDYLVLMDATASALIVNLPQASSCGGKSFLIVKVDSGGNAVTVTPFAGDSMQGAGSLVLSAQYDAALISSDGTVTWLQFTGGGAGGVWPDSISDDLGPSGANTRALDSVYHNTSGKPMLVIVTHNPVTTLTTDFAGVNVLTDSNSSPSTGVAFDVIGGLITQAPPANWQSMIMFWVKAGDYYEVESYIGGGGSVSVVAWIEAT